MSLALDFTASVSANHISNETIPIKPTRTSAIYVVLVNGPFFNKDLVVTFTDANTGAVSAMTRGVDYDSTINFPKLGVSTNQQVYGALCFYDIDMEGTLSVTYRALGGKWIMDPIQITSYLDGNLINPGIAFPAMVPTVALIQDKTLPTDPDVPLPLNSAATITLAQSLSRYANGIMLGVKFLPHIANGSKNLSNQRFASIVNVAASTTGITPPGSTSVIIKNTSAVAMTVAGGTLPAGETATFLSRPGETIYPITYITIASGSALVTTLI